MKKLKPKNIKKGVRTVLSLLFLLVSHAGMQVAIAQPPPALPGQPDQAPLGGLAILAGAGGLYAVKKLRERNAE